MAVIFGRVVVRLARPRRPGWRGGIAVCVSSWRRCVGEVGGEIGGQEGGGKGIWR